MCRRFDSGPAHFPFLIPTIVPLAETEFQFAAESPDSVSLLPSESLLRVNSGATSDNRPSAVSKLAAIRFGVIIRWPDPTRT